MIWTIYSYVRQGEKSYRNPEEETHNSLDDEDEESKLK